MSRLGPAMLASLVFVVLLVLVAVFGPWLAPYDPLAIDHLAVLRPGSPAHPMGTDEFGRDILSRLIIGIRPTLTVALGSTLIASVFGVALGVLAGLAGRGVSFVIMRATDILLSFPPILLTLLAIGFWSGGVWSLLVTIGVIYIPHFVRVVYAATAQVARQEFILADRSLGATPLRIALRGVLPNIVSPIVVQATLTVAAAILLESGASFLGLGIKPPAPSWGQMIGTARGYLADAPFYAFWPALFLAATVLAINLLGDRFRDLLDPRLS